MGANEGSAVRFAFAFILGAIPLGVLGACAEPSRVDRPAAPVAREVPYPRVRPYERRWWPEGGRAPDATTRTIPRSDWAHGVPRDGLASPMGSPELITIHHEGGPTDFDSTSRAAAARRIESIRRFHVVDRGWADIGYHYLIDPAGRIWEGRPLTLAGAHVRDRNPGNIGICVLGNFERQRPTPAQLTAVLLLVTSLQREHSIADERVFLHADLGDTACPGRHLRSALRRTGIVRDR